MTKLFNQLIILTAVIFLAACDTASTDKKTADTMDAKANFDMSAAKSAIETGNAKFIDGLKKGDSAAIAALYAGDAWVMPPNTEPVKGSDIAAFWGSVIRMGVKDAKSITDDVSGNADMLV